MLTLILLISASFHIVESAKWVVPGSCKCLRTKEKVGRNWNDWIYVDGECSLNYMAKQNGRKKPYCYIDVNDMGCGDRRISKQGLPKGQRRTVTCVDADVDRFGEECWSDGYCDDDSGQKCNYCGTHDGKSMICCGGEGYKSNHANCGKAIFKHNVAHHTCAIDYSEDSCDEKRKQCCDNVSTYGIVPYSTWGSFPKDKWEWWEANNCNAVVGGSSRSRCPYTCPSESTVEETRLAEGSEAMMEFALPESEQPDADAKDFPSRKSELLIKGLAVVGFGAVVFGAFKHYGGKTETSTEHLPIA